MRQHGETGEWPEDVSPQVISVAARMMQAGIECDPFREEG